MTRSYSKAKKLTGGKRGGKFLNVKYLDILNPLNKMKNRFVPLLISVLILFACDVTTGQKKTNVSAGQDSTNNRFHLVDTTTLLGSDILQRVFMVSNEDVFGSAFGIGYQNHDYIITARHIFKNKPNGSTFVLNAMHNGAFEALSEVTIYYHTDTAVDIAVLAMPTKNVMGNNLELAEDYILSEQCFFIGFPFGMKMDAIEKTGGFPVPFAKKAIVAGMGGYESGKSIVYLDGHNNEGFSGGPIVRIVVNGNGQKKTQIFGVVQGYINGKEKDFNSGIIVGWGSKHIIEIINSIKW